MPVCACRVAIACCRRFPTADPPDLYPDGDAGPLRVALGALGVDSVTVAWDDPEVSWGSFSHVLLSSTWDSVDRPEAFLAWARAVSQQARLVNSVTVLEWNIDKAHQRELAAVGVPTIPTTWVSPGQLWEPPDCAELVVKPSVSAGGRSTGRYLTDDARAGAHVRQLLAQGQTVMVQEYLPSIDEQGEVDVILLDGQYSHAVVKQPWLRAGEDIVERPWERMGWGGLTTPPPHQVAVATSAMAAVAELLQEMPRYGRIDLVTGADGDPRVLEAELIDPYLSLDAAPAAARRLADIVIAS